MNAAAYIHSLHAQLAITRGGEVVSREEYLAYLTFRANTRPLFTEIFGPLLGLRDEWKAQGATLEELSFAAFRYRDGQETSLPVHTGWLGGDAPVILEESADHLVYRDHMGRRMQLAKTAATLALPTTYPVATMDDWRRIKHHYEYAPARLGSAPSPPGWITTVHIPGGFDEPRQLLGEEALALACYEQPELLHDILQTIGDTVVRVLEQVRFDQLAVHEDMAGRNGPLFGPKQVEEFIGPYYRRAWTVAQERGARLFKQDSDGDMRPVLPAFLAAGVNVIYPCEPTAGMDIVKLRAVYGPRLAFIGGLDKHVLRRSREEIVAELEYKLPPLIQSGGCVFGLDHRIPNGTPLAHYRFYVAKVWEILARTTS